MSKIGIRPVFIPDGVTADIADRVVTVTGPKGTLTVPRLDGVAIVNGENGLEFSLSGKSNQAKMNWGTMRSLVANAIGGVTEGYKKVLEINGVGYRAELAGSSINLKVGFSHVVQFPIPKGIEVVIEGNKITISGIERQLVGQVAADIRKIKKPEPYLGKGIKYDDEVIRRKAGKKAAGAGA